MAFNRLWRDREIKIVILDTSALILCFEYPIDIEYELIRLLGKCKIIVPKQVIEELELLMNKGKDRKRLIAKPALEIAKRFELSVIDTNEKGDDAIIKYAKNFSGFVFTNDHKLKRRLKKESISVIYLRGKKRLVVE
jgi:rRNA-processing protein FCF1